MSSYSPSQATTGINVMALISTSLSIGASPDSGVVPLAVNVIGVLRDSAGTPLVGKSVVLYMNGAYVDTRITVSPSGQYGFSVVINAAGTYLLQTKFAGDVTYAGCSSNTVTVTATEVVVIPTSITITAPSSVSVGQAFTVSGRLTRNDTGAGIAGQTIYLYFDASALGHTVPVTDASGYYSCPDAAIVSAGSYTLKAEFLGASGVAAAEATRGIGVTGGAATYIVYDSDLSDKRSAELIAEKKGFTLLQTPETKDPSVYDALYDDNNIVCVGGGLADPVTGLPYANAYSYYYFPMRWGSDGLLYGQFGISADGRRIIATKRRANGTTVTIVSGIDEADTWRAANEYCKEPVSPLVPVGILAAAMGGAYYVSRR